MVEELGIVVVVLGLELELGLGLELGRRRFVGSHRRLGWQREQTQHGLVELELGLELELEPGLGLASHSIVELGVENRIRRIVEIGTF